MCVWAGCYYYAMVIDDFFSGSRITHTQIRMDYLNMDNDVDVDKIQIQNRKSNKKKFYESPSPQELEQNKQQKWNCVS